MADFKTDINNLVDLMIQADSIRESIAEIKKAIKAEHSIPIATITKVATIIRKQNIEDEQEKWDTIRAYVDSCSK
jgi:hypothetical protein